MADNAQTDAELDGDQTILEPKLSKGWIDLIKTAEKVFNDWQQKCTNIDKLYADLMQLSSTTREREFQLFWANVQVLGPSIYSRPPIPVVTPRFKDRRPIARTASEVLERTSIVAIEQEDIDSVMVDLRNDLTTISRGAVWIYLENDKGELHVCVDHVERSDFLHDPARKWKEVDWVAKRSWLTRSQARKRFYSTSKNEYQTATYTVRKEGDNGYKEGDTRLKAPFWELWSKSSELCVWVAEGCEKVLDESAPEIELEGFFPCPKPAYGTLQRGTLIPVPDMLFYKDQLEEINEITGRIAALTESLRVKGFYPAGAGNISDAIEAAMKSVTNNQMLVPVSDWTLLGGMAPKDIIFMVPIDQIALVVKELIELRKQLIDDVYQITGLSDIMRGSTVASETLGAQKLKSQYGSVRIRDRQGELVRMARDITRLTAEIIAENYTQKTIVDMSQMQLPTNAEIKQQISQLQMQGQQIEQQVAQAKQNPQIMAMAQQDPQKAQEAEQQAQEQLQAITGQIDKLGQTVTIDQVMKFLRDNRMRAFTLDIETDSTIQPDEDAAKQRATEFITAMSSIFQQAIPAAESLPQIAPLMSEVINYASKQFRVGRTMETAIEEFADQMKQMAGQAKPDPNAAQAQTDQAKIASDQKIALASGILEKHKIDTTSTDNQAKADMEWRKAVLSALTTLEAASISAKATNDGILLEAQLESELGLQDKAHEMAMAGIDQAHQVDMTQMDQTHQADMATQAQDSAVQMNDAKLAAAPAKPNGAAKPAAAPSGLADIMKKHFSPPAPPPPPDNSEILLAIANLAKVLTAPQQVTTPEGRTFTSQRMLN